MGAFTCSTLGVGQSGSSSIHPTANHIAVAAINLLNEPEKVAQLDTEDITRILTALKSHHEIIREVRTLYNDLFDDFQESPLNQNALETDIADLRTKLATLEQELAAKQTPTIPSNRSCHSLRFPDPPNYDGNRTDLGGFKYNLQSKLRINADWFPTEKHKINYAFTRLVGKAQTQILPRVMWPDGPAGISTVQQFTNALDDCFGDPDLAWR